MVKPMSNEPEEADDLDALIAAMDAALTAEFGPNHQEILSRGEIIAALEW